MRKWKHAKRNSIGAGILLAIVVFMLKSIPSESFNYFIDTVLDKVTSKYQNTGQKNMNLKISYSKVAVTSRKREPSYTLKLVRGMGNSYNLDLNVYLKVKTGELKYLYLYLPASDTKLTLNALPRMYPVIGSTSKNGSGYYEMEDIHYNLINDTPTLAYLIAENKALSNTRSKKYDISYLALYTPPYSFNRDTSFGTISHPNSIIPAYGIGKFYTADQLINKKNITLTFEGQRKILRLNTDSAKQTREQILSRLPSP